MRPRTEKAHRSMQRKSTAALCLLVVVMLLACSRNGPPNSLFESAGYHVRDGKVYYLNAFPGKAFEMGGADPATFEALDSTYARDNSHVYINGALLPDADAASFELLQRPGFAKDRDHVYQRDRVLSDDPAHFELLDGELAKDSRVVYRSDGSVLSEDPGTLRDHLRRRSLPVHERRQARSRQRQPHSRGKSCDIPSPARCLRTRQ